MAKGSKRRLREKQQKKAETMDVDGDEQPSARSPAKDLNSSHDTAVLKPQHKSGVQKVKTQKKLLRRNQRLRHEKGVERAEAVMDQLQKKVGESKQKGKAIKDRRHDWDNINSTMETSKPRSKPRSKILRATQHSLSEDVQHSTSHESAHDETLMT